MEFGIDQYITRVDKTPAMGTHIRLFEGVRDSSILERRPHLLTFLKGTKYAKDTLRENQPKLWNYFARIWKVRNDHWVDSPLPPKYFFLLKCCGNTTCIHPLCQRSEIKDFTWYKDGPSIENALPIPVISTLQCDKCDNCDGHYVRDITLRQEINAADVPSILLTDEFENDEELTVDRRIALASKCILPPGKVSIYWNHLIEVKKNRKRGVEKAKLTRLKNAAARNTASM